MSSERSASAMTAPARFAALRRASSYRDDPESMFDRLPLELQAEVFSHCLPAYPALGDTETPMMIAQVCHAWRSLAYSTPRLWSSFEIEVEDWSTSDAAEQLPHTLRVLSRVNLWLERSKAQPLSFRLVHLPTGRVPNPLSASLLARLAAHSRRWHHIEIKVPSTCLSGVQHLLPEDFPTIKTLTLHMRGVWNSVGFDFRGGLLGVPFTTGNQLTELDLRLDQNHLLNLDDCVELLSSATNLQVCRLNANCSMARSTRDNSDKLELPSLRSLHLALQGGVIDEAAPTIPQASTLSATPLLAPEPSLLAFLNIVSDSALTHFGINWLIDGERTTHWTPSVQMGLTSFLRDLSPSLRSLEMTYLPLGEDGLLQCLALLPRLEDLDLRFSLADQVHDPITDKVLQALVVGRRTEGVAEGRRRSASPAPVSSQPVVPALRKLRLQCTGVHCKQASLVKMVDSRISVMGQAQHGPCLRSFGFYSMHQVVDDQCTKRWLKAGLEATFDSVVLF